jgi:hypothetical protein
MGVLYIQRGRRVFGQLTKKSAPCKTCLFINRGKTERPCVRRAGITGTRGDLLHRRQTEIRSSVRDAAGQRAKERAGRGSAGLVLVEVVQASCW